MLPLNSATATATPTTPRKRTDAIVLPMSMRFDWTRWENTATAAPSATYAVQIIHAAMRVEGDLVTPFG